MSSQISWQCLSVQQFFNVCNWQGQTELGKQEWAVISNQNSWQCLSVEKLFRFFNWQGQAIENTDWQYQPLNLTRLAKITATNSQTSWKCLSVQQFFSLCSWQDQPLENTELERANSSSLLTLQTREFFQFIPWESSPEIGSLPKVSSISGATFSETISTTLTDLSGLF